MYKIYTDMIRGQSNHDKMRTNMSRQQKNITNNIIRTARIQNPNETEAQLSFLLLSILFKTEQKATLKSDGMEDDYSEKGGWKPSGDSDASQSEDENVIGDIYLSLADLRYFTKDLYLYFHYTHPTV